MNWQQLDPDRPHRLHAAIHPAAEPGKVIKAWAREFPSALAPPSLPLEANARAMFDMLGREVATLVNEEMEPGTYSARFEANGHASGVYVYRLTAGSFSKVHKMMLMK